MTAETPSGASGSSAPPWEISQPSDSRGGSRCTTATRRARPPSSSTTATKHQAASAGTARPASVMKLAAGSSRAAVGAGGEVVHVVAVEVPPAPRVDTGHAPRMTRTTDDHAQPAHDAVSVEKTRLRLLGHRDDADRSGPPADAGTQQRSVAAGETREALHALELERVGDESHRFRQQHAQVTHGERALSECGNRGLLTLTNAQRVLECFSYRLHGGAAYTDAPGAQETKAKDRRAAVASLTIVRADVAAPRLLCGFCNHRAPRRQRMGRFLLGMIVGAAAVWFYGRDLIEYVDDKTRIARSKAADTLHSAAETLQGARETIDRRIS